ncbi:hypothetical protein BJX61DRAFT_229398 [Aspergillus egyptiacus]|nr:hypothetical protein BJX61DRAFT_229398 [Aspergillus egyptiacus]
MDLATLGEYRIPWPAPRKFPHLTNRIQAKSPWTLSSLNPRIPRPPQKSRSPETADRLRDRAQHGAVRGAEALASGTSLPYEVWGSVLRQRKLFTTPTLQSRPQFRRGY